MWPVLPGPLGRRAVLFGSVAALRRARWGLIGHKLVFENTNLLTKKGRRTSYSCTYAVRRNTEGEAQGCSQ